MASFKLILDKYEKTDGTRSIQIRIIINRRSIVRKTEFSVRERDWDKARGRVRSRHKNFTAINDALERIARDAEREFALSIAAGGRPDSLAIADKTFATHDFYEFAEQRIKAMTGETELRTKRKYEAWLEGLKEFRPTLSFEDITPDLIEGYRTFLKAKKNKHNTIIGRLSSFRATVNAAPVHLRGTAFKEITVGTFRPAETKEALSVQDITTLWNYEPSAPGEALVRDTFLFSYYAAGMRIGDVIQLRWKDISEDKIVYAEGKKRHLGKGKLYIPLNAYALTLIERQPQTGNYIFGELHSKDAQGLVKEIESREAVINNALFKIAVRAGINKHLTGKVARDTFADIANKRSQRNVYGISKAMGHGSIKVTELYLGNDQSAIDELLKQVYE